ncbi:hypothetical protein GW796_05755 [archaeon]|nr:hypothetical protein [archaeon]NCQ51389.1 hypothetical protein [archaeon]NCT58785.1 hypothetical protein [archaeon]
MSQALRKNDIVQLNPVEHCLLRAPMYIGSTSEEKISSYVYENGYIVQKDIPQIPGILKLYDEILTNAVDESIRTNFQYANKIKVTFNKTEGSVTIEDNGRGLPIEKNIETGIYTPEQIYTNLNAGSNFDDENKAMLAGMNGVGGSLAAIFSRKFIIDTANGKFHYKQLLENHIAIKRPPIIKKSNKNFTIITYFLNYNYFNISDDVNNNLDSLYHKRITDLAFAYPEIEFTYNKEKIHGNNLKSFLKQIHEVYECNEVENARIGLFYSDTDFQQMSWVNGTHTSRGGTHIDYALSLIVDYLRNFLKKKHKIDVKPLDIKSKLFLILAIRMKAPSFDNQSKERLISNNNFKDLINELLSEKLLKSICKNEEIILPIVESYKLKQQVKDNIELKKLNSSKKKIRIDKYYPAVKQQTYLMLSEGDSANSLLMPVIGREKCSFFPLKGKPLNSLEASITKITSNEELKNIISILNLRLDKDIQSISHQKIVFATDSDLDGISIRGLLLCLFQRFAPSLIANNQVSYLKTPMIVAKKRNKILKCFYSFEEYNIFKENNKENYEYFYKKGLGSWKKDELKYIFAKDGLESFIVDFEVEDSYEDYIKNWMSGKTVTYRKEKVKSKQFDINGV